MRILSLFILISVIGLSACSQKSKEVSRPGVAVGKIVEIITPNTLLMELNVAKKSIRGNPFVKHQTIQVHFAEISIPMSQYECNRAWPVNRVSQSIKHLIYGHATDAYGATRYHFDQLCYGLKKRLVGKTVSVAITDANYEQHRINGVVTHKNRHINSELVKEGWARYNHNQSHLKLYRDAQIEAAYAKRGLWALAPSECGFSLTEKTRCPSHTPVPQHGR